ncbi:DUF2334 domain-containing protein [Butyrivibrio sp. NC3005]|uniref:DUF2334 domain-containing protein n=1 Tax=Butyrivibrio sp. NC3005 TaxID=1280685 RepID=UPI00040EDBBF|nr:DUF2334 domain-containing protein [Butyrivibrio sp. NC3005]
MKIAIRMDDITPDMDYQKFERFISLLKKYNVTALLGIVPDNKDAKLSIDMPRCDFWDEVLKLQEEGFVLAMHGYNHVYTTRKGGLIPLNHQSEYAGLSFERQDEMIRKGKEILESHGIKTDFFMAPSHTFDKNTLKALKKNGFLRITDGFGDCPYEYMEMIFYPISFRKSKALSTARKGTVTFVVHANTMKEKEYEQYEKILSSGKVISYDKLLEQKICKKKTLHRVKEYAMASFKYHVRTIMEMKKWVITMKKNFSK